MKPTCVSACVLAVAASLAGCTGTGEVEYAGEVRVTSPELVLISPGVQVIADADEPLFYSHGYYWLYRDGYWFRSDSYRSGFARVDFVYVPGELRVIDWPQLYVQYRRHVGHERFARPPQQQTRTPPTYPDTYHPNRPVTPGSHPDGVNPKTPLPPSATPNESPREPYPQRTVPPDVEHPSPAGQAQPRDDRPNQSESDKDKGKNKKNEKY